jgi:hypothetical protein
MATNYATSAQKEVRRDKEVFRYLVAVVENSFSGAGSHWSSDVTARYVARPCLIGHLQSRDFCHKLKAFHWVLSS